MPRLGKHRKVLVGLTIAVALAAIYVVVVRPWHAEPDSAKVDAAWKNVVDAAREGPLAPRERDGAYAAIVAAVLEAKDELNEADDKPSAPSRVVPPKCSAAGARAVKRFREFGATPLELRAGLARDAVCTDLLIASGGCCGSTGVSGSQAARR